MSEKAPHKRLTIRALSAMISRLGQKVGVKVSTHRLRKLFETRMAISSKLGRHPIVLKYWMGHKIRKGKGDIEAKYIIPDEQTQRELYMDGYQHLDVHPKVDTYELFKAEMKTRLQGLPPRYRKRFLTEIEVLYKDMATRLMTEEDVIKLIQEQTVAQGGLAFDTSQFERIQEEDLLMYLRAGWKIVHKLENGNLIVKR